MADTIDRITRDLKTRDKSVRAVYVHVSLGSDSCARSAISQQRVFTDARWL
jgi:hypothetical protein